MKYLPRLGNKPLPMSPDELPYGTTVDFVYVTGDAYVDHPSFGTAIIARVLEHAGFTVGIIAQPDYKNMYKDGSRKRRMRIRQAEAWFFGKLRQHGFDGCTLYSGQKAPQ